MNDILPEEARHWQRIESTFREIAGLYGYGEVRTPILEDTSLFVRQIGETTDVVEKEMYTFERHGDSMTVRPERTAGTARAYVEHNVANKEPISRWYYLGPMFRGERPAKGRYRQFYQAGCELYGDPGPVCDAEMIELAVRVLVGLGIGDLKVHVNSLGSGDTRERYRQALLDHLAPHKAALSEDSQRRLEKNPLRILDSKDAKDRALAEAAPSILDVLSDEDRAHFDGVRRGLDALGVDHVVDTKLVRGLDYYTRTLFEIKAEGADLGAQSTVCGGGRYDGMVRSLGGPSVPAIGFAMGLERILVAMGAQPEVPKATAVYVAVLFEGGIAAGLALAKQARDLGVGCEIDSRGKLKAMMARADRSGARLAVIVGEDELAKGVVMVKTLATREQEEVALDRFASFLTEKKASITTPARVD